MSYDFKVLGQVDSVEEFPEGASVLIESQGEVKRCAADGLGGGGFVIDAPVDNIDGIFNYEIIPVDEDTLIEAVNAYKSGAHVVAHISAPFPVAPMGVDASQFPDEVQAYCSVDKAFETIFDIASFEELGGMPEEVMLLLSGPFMTYRHGSRAIVLMTQNDFNVVMSELEGGGVTG